MGHHRVLLVDDQKDVRSVLRSGLETLKGAVQVQDVPSAEEALLVLSRQPIDLLITDVRLAGITGLELLAKVRARSPQIKVILMTGMTDERTRRQVREAQVEACFFKPVAMASFLDTVLRCLDGQPAPTTAVPGTQELPQERARPEERACLQEQAYKTIESRLSRLHQETGAKFTALINSDGRLVEQCGELGERTNQKDFEAALAASLAASSRLASVLEAASTPPHIDPFSRASTLLAGPYRIWYTPVGERQALVVVRRDEPEAGNGLLSEAAGRAARELIQLTAAAPPPSTAAPMPDPVEEDQAAENCQPDENLASILQDAAMVSLEAHDVADFWETAVEENGPGYPSEWLSFEQARQLGLAPDDVG